jgi:ubiquinone/menaquinone biosynthesis C-methylase UbiE
MATQTVNASRAFSELVRFWRDRYKQHGDKASGRLGEDHKQQQKRIEALLKPYLPDVAYFPRGLDFGCGPGRFAPLLSKYCGHLWLADVAEEQARKAAHGIRTATPVKVTYPLKLPILDGSIDLLWDGMTIQSIANGVLVDQTLEELRRVMRPGCTFLSLHVITKKRSHVFTRSPEIISKALGLVNVEQQNVAVDKAPESYWFFKGTKG